MSMLALMASFCCRTAQSFKTSSIKSGKCASNIPNIRKDPSAPAHEQLLHHRESAASKE